MTKEQFTSGTPFTIIADNHYKGENTFRYYPEVDCIMSQGRSCIDERVLFEGHHLNVSKIGEKGFEGFVYVMNKMVKVKFKYTEMQEFIKGA